MFSFLVYALYGCEMIYILYIIYLRTYRIFFIYIINRKKIYSSLYLHIFELIVLGICELYYHSFQLPFASICISSYTSHSDIHIATKIINKIKIIKRKKDKNNKKSFKPSLFYIY